jgi:hypothetical protein
MRTLPLTESGLVQVAQEWVTFARKVAGAK